jgi:hypothetical protein
MVTRRKPSIRGSNSKVSRNGKAQIGELLVSLSGGGQGTAWHLDGIVWSHCVRLSLKDGRGLYDVGMSFSGAQGALDLLWAQPFIGGYEVPREDRKDRHRAKYGAGKVERLGRDGVKEWRDPDLCNNKSHGHTTKPVKKKKAGQGQGQEETHGKDEQVEQHGREVHGLRPSSEIVIRRLERVRRARQAQPGDERVGRYGRHAAGRYERRERDLARYDREQQHGRKDEHDRHRVLRLSIAVHAADPVREREHAVARDGEEEPRTGHHGYTGILRNKGGEIFFENRGARRCFVVDKDTRAP